MSKVIRIARSDEQDGFILMHVLTSGSGLLNLTLTATEGECPYTATIQERRLKDLRAKNYQGSDEEWIQIITHVFGQETTAAKLESCAGVEISASIAGTGEDNKEIVLTIRKRVQSITQKLGAITLTQDDDQAIELFEWSGIAAAKADELKSQVVDLAGQHRVAEDTIHKLKKQLEELTQAKVEHESKLVASFAQLLNEKKLKIRNQQRLLACATVNPAKVSEIQATSTHPGGTRGEEQSTKRNADDMNDSEDTTSDGFEKMEIDPKGTVPPDDQDTDQATEQDTDDEHQSISQASEKSEHTESDNEPDEPAETGHSTRASDQAGGLRRSSPKEEAPPPRRELPFSKTRSSGKPGPAPSQNEVAEETGGETDDDEL
ncbi:hypothetical protein N7478_011328 [Penicillium angulare]|uniref:uncharacterized protein n=1 Tax=Penicillium angulare TaxID=116970 RepID=UPI0025404996|nr:uncharacterized protein N7478_011328 [Penicillium angulare]KAJ5263723.1 hypothetical protein N7478_011328 [Penicillium angulare]